MSTYREIAAQMIADGEGTVKQGDRHVVYDDATGRPIKAGDTIKGHPTIARGRNLAAKGISDEEARMMLMEDVRDAEDIARGFIGQVPWQALGDVRRAVLMDMAHNLGAEGLYAFAKLRKAIHNLDYETAAREIALSRYFEQVGRRGVRNRDAMRTGSWERPGSERLVPRGDVGPRPAMLADEAPAEADDGGARVWTLMRHTKLGTRLWWMGGYARNDNPGMFQPMETRLERLAARLTRAEADDELMYEPRIRGQGYDVVRMAEGAA